MSDHDPLCPARKIRPDLRGTLLVYSLCQCALIDRVRADERRQMDMAAVIDREEIADEVRERIAQEFAALYDEAKHQMRATGYDAYVEGRMDAFDRAEHIARGGTP